MVVTDLLYIHRKLHIGIFIKEKEDAVKFGVQNPRVNLSKNMKGYCFKYYFSYIELTIAAKSVAFKAAPPISPPSTSGFEKISLAFSGLTLPP